MSGTYQPIPNFVGVNAGQQFREAINDALGGTVPISPAMSEGSVTGGTISGANVSAAVAAAMLTDAALRTVAQRATDSINFADYAGADPTGSTDMSTLVNQALSDARAQKKALRFPAGTWGMATYAAVQQGDVIVGDGAESTIKYIGAGASGGNPAVFWTDPPIGAISPPAEGAPLVFSNLHVVGPWNGTTATTQMTGPMIGVHGLDSVIFDRVFVEYAPNVSINAGLCRRVTAVNCKIRFGARDGIQCEGSAMVDIIGGQFDHIDDNVVSNHSSNSQIWGLASATNIVGIRASDTGGILCAGARRINIMSNVIERPKQLGIGVAYTAEGSTEGESCPLAVRILGNHITDVINRENIDGINANCTYIQITAVPAQAGASSASVGVPGTNLTILPAVWEANTAVVAGLSTIDSGGHIQTVTTAGTTGSSAPSWNETPGLATTDGTAAWTNEGSGIVAALVPTGRAWAASTAFIVGAAIVDGNGNVQTCTASGTTGTTAPSWASVSASTTTDGGVTWTCEGTNTADGAVASPYGAFNNMKSSPSDTTTPIPPGWAIDISHNTCMRTFDPTANRSYSQSNAGGEQMFTRNGWLNPLLGTVELENAAMGVAFLAVGALPTWYQHVRIACNHIQGMNDAVYLAGGAALVGADVHDNKILDFANTVFFLGTKYAAHRFDIRTNEFDGDPFLVRRGGASGGKWASGLTAPSVGWWNGCSGVTFRQNRIRNVATVAGSALGADALIKDNIVFCQPAASGYNAANVGVGNIPAAGAGYMHVIEQGNPGSPSFGQAINGPVLEAAAMPSSGTFVQGQIVWSSAATAESSIIGWYRATTGSSNVLGTDWLAISIPSLLSISEASSTVTLEPASSGNAMQVQGAAGEPTVLGAAGALGSSVVFDGAQADNTLQIVAAGSSYTCPNYVTTIYFTASAAISAFTFTLPTSPDAGNGQSIRFSFNQAVTALTTAHGTSSVDGTHASLTAHQLVEYVWDLTNTTWRMLQ